MGLGKQLDFGGRHAPHQVLGFQLRRRIQSGSCQHFGQRLEGVAVEVEHALGLVRHHQRALAQGVLSGDAGWAFVGVTRMHPLPTSNMDTKSPYESMNVQNDDVHLICMKNGLAACLVFHNVHFYSLILAEFCLHAVHLLGFRYSSGLRRQSNMSGRIFDELQALRDRRDQLDIEIQALSELPEFEQQVRLCREFTSLTARYGLTPNEGLEILSSSDLDVPFPLPKVTPRQHRPNSSRKVYKHPDTGERLEAFEGRSKLLRMWIEAYGLEVVEGWVIQESANVG